MDRTQSVVTPERFTQDMTEEGQPVSRHTAQLRENQHVSSDTAGAGCDRAPRGCEAMPHTHSGVCRKLRDPQRRPTSARVGAGSPRRSCRFFA